MYGKNAVGHLNYGNEFREKAWFKMLRQISQVSKGIELKWTDTAKTRNQTLVLFFAMDLHLLIEPNLL